MRTVLSAGLATCLLALVACGVKGPPQRPGAAEPARRTVIGASTTTEAPAAPVAAPKRERRFILDGLL